VSAAPASIGQQRELLWDCSHAGDLSDTADDSVRVPLLTLQLAAAHAVAGISPVRIFTMQNQSLIVRYAIAFVRIAVNRLRDLLNERDHSQGRAALARFENEGGAIERRPAPTRKVMASRSGK
jgi:hypothetical protein